MNTVRWADRVTQTVAIGATVATRDLFRVTAPHPCVWRILMFAEVRNAANFGVSFTLDLFVGIGSMMNQYSVPFPNNSLNTLEVPGQSLMGRIRGGVAIAGDTWVLDAGIAPLVPWEGLKVKVQR